MVIRDLWFVIPVSFHSNTNVHSASCLISVYSYNEPWHSRDCQDGEVMKKEKVFTCQMFWIARLFWKENQSPKITASHVGMRQVEEHMDTQNKAKRSLELSKSWTKDKGKRKLRTAGEWP